MQVPQHVFFDAVDNYRIRLAADVLLNRFFLFQLLSQLIEVSDLQVGTDFDFTSGRIQLAQQRFQQRRFTGSVVADDSDFVFTHDGGRKVFEHFMIAVFKRNVGRFDYQVTTALAFLDLQVRGPDFRASFAAFGSQGFECANSAFIAGPPSLNPLTNPSLFFGQLFIKQGVLLLFSSQRVLFSLQKRLVIATPIKQPASIDFQNSI